MFEKSGFHETLHKLYFQHSTKLPVQYFGIADLDELIQLISLMNQLDLQFLSLISQLTCETDKIIWEFLTLNWRHISKGSQTRLY